MINKDEFVQLIQDNQGLIYKVTSVYSKDQEDQKDLYQEIVYQLWKSFGSFQEKSKVSTWMYRVALNTALTHYKRSKKKGEKVNIDFELLNIVDEQDPIIELRLKLLHEQIKNLNVIEKGLILLYLEGKKYEEIASITGFSTSNVGTRLGRIKQKLKAKLKTT